MSLTGSFTGKDLLVTWNRNSANDVPGIVFRDYEVSVIVDSVILRVEYVTEPSFIYYYDDMVADQGERPSREVRIEVCERDTFLRKSEPAAAIFTNPAPTAPAFTLTPTFSDIVVNMTKSDDADVDGYMVFRDEDNNFTASANNIVYKGRNNQFTDSDLNEETTYWYRVAAYDLFDDSIEGATTSGALSSELIELDFTINEYDFIDLEFDVDANNNIEWSSFDVVIRAGNDVETRNVDGGDVQWTSGTLILFYDPETNEIDSDTNLAAIYGGEPRRRVVATYDGDILRDGTSKPIINGADIIAQTIGATQIVAGSIGTNQLAAQAVTADKVTTSNLLTTSAQIANGIITTAKIDDLAVTNGKIANLAVSSGKIENAAITTAKIDDLAITSAKIAGTIESDDFESGPDGTGWRIQKNGAAEFGTLALRENAITNFFVATRVGNHDVTSGWTTELSLPITSTEETFYFFLNLTAVGIRDGFFRLVRGDDVVLWESEGFWLGEGFYFYTSGFNTFSVYYSYPAPYSFSVVNDSIPSGDHTINLQSRQTGGQSRVTRNVTLIALETKR